MDILADARRRAFSLWLRTGRLPRWTRIGTAEFKFNPWHDPDDGRFTFAGTGRYFGRGDGGANRDTAAHSRRRKPPFGGYGGGQSGGGGASGSWEAEADPQRESGERRPAERTANRPTRIAPDASLRPARSALDNRRNWRSVRRNGYEWKIDSVERPREITGTFSTSETSRRSRRMQAQAGGPDRRRTDDGGHYIAPRFNGPTEAFNHFAQDRNFNRGRYRALEDQWARADQAGKKVRFRIVPLYKGSSRRPYLVNVWFWIGGERRSLQFPNEPLETNDARR